MVWGTLAAPTDWGTYTIILCPVSSNVSPNHTNHVRRRFTWRLPKTHCVERTHLWGTMFKLIYDDDDVVALNSEESGKWHCTNIMLSLVGLERSGGVPSSHPFVKRIASERHWSNTPIGMLPRPPRGPSTASSRAKRCKRMQWASSKNQNLIAHPILATQNMEMEQRQPYHIITNPVIRTECDSAIPDTCKQGPRVLTRPQTRKTNRKRGHQHLPNFRETRYGQKSGALHQLISQETRVFQSLQMPFGGVDIARAGLSQLAGHLTCFTKSAGAFAPLMYYTLLITMSGPLGRPQGGLSTWPSHVQTNTCGRGHPQEILDF